MARRSLRKANKLTSYRSPSPALSSSSDEEEAPSLEHTDTDNSSGLPEPVQKQLVIDIVARGGIDDFSLSKLQHEKPDIYGKRNGNKVEQKRHRQVENKVYRWKKPELDRDEYNTRILSYGSPGPSQLQSPPQITSSSKRKSPWKSPDLSETPALPNASPARRTPPAPSNASPARRTPPAPSNASPARRTPPRPPQPTPSKMSNVLRELLLLPHSKYRGRAICCTHCFSLSTFLALLLTAEVEVDLVFPERNDPLDIIVSFTDEKAGDFLHDGYDMELHDVDTRAMMGEEPKYVMHHLGGNRVFFKMSSTKHSFANDADVEAKGKKIAKWDQERIDTALDILRNDIAGDPARQFKHYLIKFVDHDGNPINLDNEQFSPGAEHGKIHAQGHSASAHPQRRHGPKHESTHHLAAFFGPLQRRVAHCA